MAASGGGAGLLRYIALMDAIVEGAREAGFPDFPLNVSYEQTFNFFQEIIQEFGENFPQILVPFFKKDLGVTDISMLSEMIIGTF